MTINITRRIDNPKSYQRLYRNRHLVAKKLNLSDQEYRLWDLYGAVSGWDKRYEDIYQIVHATDEQMAEILMWSPSKTCRIKKELIKKKIVRVKTRGVYEILLIPSPDSETANVQDNSATMQDKIADTKDETATLQAIQGQSNNSSLYSSKGVYGSLRSEEEYRDVKKREVEVSKRIDEANGWLSDDSQMKKLVKKQQRLANQMLMYEIENDLLPI